LINLELKKTGTLSIDFKENLQDFSADIVEEELLI